MTVSLQDFKTRFGKKPVDAIDPKQRFDDRLRQVWPKVKAARARNVRAELELIAEFENLARTRDFHAAADVLDEIERTTFVDTARADLLRQRLETLVAPVRKEDGAMPPALDGLCAPIEAAIAEDRYDEADDLLDDAVPIIDDFRDEVTKFEGRLIEVDGWAKQIGTRNRAGEASTPQKGQQLNQFFGLLTTFKQNVNARVFDQAETNFGTLKSAAEALIDDEDADDPEKLYKGRLDDARTVLRQWKGWSTDNDPLLQQHKAVFDKVVVPSDEAQRLAGEDEFADALGSLDEALAAIPPGLAALKRQYEQVKSGAPSSDELRRRRDEGQLPEPASDYNDAADAVFDLARDAASAASRDDYGTALKKIAQYVPAARSLAQIMDVELKKGPKPGKYKDLVTGGDRQAILAALSQQDADMAAFRREPGGAKLLDDMVDEIGPKADSKDKREFVRLAMMARFDLKQVSGGADGKGMSSKALPRLYKLMKDLPDDHLLNNELIDTVERLKAKDTSSHNQASQKVLLKAGKTGKEGSFFDDTTLHEIGHGVDAKFAFMRTNGKALAFGQWRDETKASVAKVAGEGLGFYADFTDAKRAQPVARQLLEKYLDAVLSGKGPQSLKGQFNAAATANNTLDADLKAHAAVLLAKDGFDKLADKTDTDQQRDLFKVVEKKIKDKEPMRSLVWSVAKAVCEGGDIGTVVTEQLAALALTGPLPADDKTWEEMALHPAVDFCANAQMKPGDSGLWEQGDAGAQRCAVGGRVYQQSYATQWHSYSLAARRTKVSDYQFRHPMEWFSECYSRFFLKKLPGSHPLAKWLATQVTAAPDQN